MTGSGQTVLVTGGAGYVGSALVPELLRLGYKVKVLDLYWFIDPRPQPHLECIKADLRDLRAVKEALKGVDQVIHLACISNDPSFELNPELGKTINYDAFLPLITESKNAGVKRFIYASSSSVYGVKSDPEVTEDLPLEPLTDYSKFKALCERDLENFDAGTMDWVIVRPATVCGYSPRLRLDLTVNILTHHAIEKGKITVFGGGQKRPNLHIKDMVRAYVQLLTEKRERIHGKIFNCGYENFTVSEIAEMVKSQVGPEIAIHTEKTLDNRSYHVSSAKIARELGFKPIHTIEEAICDLKNAFQSGLVPNANTDSRYYNIKRMQELAQT